MDFLKKNIKYIFMLLPFFEPIFISYFDYLKSLGYVFTGARIIVTLFVCIKYILEKRYSKIINIIIIFELSMVIASYFNKTLYLGYVVGCVTTIGFVILSERLLKKDTKSYLQSLITIFTSYGAINYIVFKLFPNGLVANRYGDGSVFFLGTKNNFIIYFLPALCFAYCYAQMRNNKINKYDYILMIFITFLVFSSNSITSIIGIILFWLYIALINYDKFSNITSYIFNEKVYVGVIIFLFIYLVLLQEKNFITGFISSHFNRDITFSGRDSIWKLAINYFLESPIWGKGIGISFKPWTNGVLVYSAHNYILDLACKFGVFPVIIYIYMCIITFKKLVINRISKSIKVISFSVFIFLLISLFEVYDPITRLLFIIVPYIISENISENEKLLENA